MKKCSKCKELKDTCEFGKHRRAADGLSVYCKPCDRAATKAAKAKRRLTAEGVERDRAANRATLKKVYATPEGRAKYLNMNAKRRGASTFPGEEDAIRAIYTLARQLELEDGIKRHVDHIIPINGKWVSGLHVVANLQILTAEQNMSKGNRL